MGWAGVASTGSAGVRGFPSRRACCPLGRHRVGTTAPGRAGPGGEAEGFPGRGRDGAPPLLSPPLEPLAVHTPSLVCPVTVPTTFLSLTSTW